MIGGGSRSAGKNTPLLGGVSVAVLALLSSLSLSRDILLSLGVLASHWLGRACDARISLIGQRKHSVPFFGAGLRSEAMEAPPTSVLGTHAREEGRWWQERRRDVVVVVDV